MMSNTWILQAACVGVGGFAGAMSRFWLTKAISARLPNVKFPLGTLAVNAIGSLLLGLLWGWNITGLSLLLLGTGFLGAFTTFSTFKLESEAFLADNEPHKAWLYIGVSYSLGILLAACGFWLAHSI